MFISPQKPSDTETSTQLLTRTAVIKYYNYDIVFQEFPNEVTLAINLSLCPNGCPGCHSAFLQGDIGEELTESRLKSLVSDLSGEITCVGLMGGDNDPMTVAQLLQSIKKQFGEQIRTGWYSGKQNLPQQLPLEAFDYIKLGPYRKDMGPLNARTTNQRLYRIDNGEMEDITSNFWKQNGNFV